MTTRLVAPLTVEGECSPRSAAADNLVEASWQAYVSAKAALMRETSSTDSSDVSVVIVTIEVVPKGDQS